MSEPLEIEPETLEVLERGGVDATKLLVRMEGLQERALRELGKGWPADREAELEELADGIARVLPTAITLPILTREIRENTRAVRECRDQLSRTLATIRTSLRGYKHPNRNKVFALLAEVEAAARTK